MQSIYESLISSKQICFHFPEILQNNLWYLIIASFLYHTLNVVVKHDVPIITSYFIILFKAKLNQTYLIVYKSLSLNISKDATQVDCFKLL